MAIRRTDNIPIVVKDLAATQAFFAEFGMELKGETTPGGPEQWR